MEKESFFKKIYRDDAPFGKYLAVLFCVGLSYGLHKGVIDNYLAEIVGMGEFDRGVTEFFRELPGFLLVAIFALMYRFSAETIFKIGAVVMLAGMGLLSAVPPSRVAVIIAICVYSLGEHIQLGMKNTLGVSYAREGKSGESMGCQTSFYDAGSLIGYIAVICLFLFLPSTGSSFRLVFAVASAILVCAASVAFGMNGNSDSDGKSKRFYFRRKFVKYYLLEVTYGARKQVFFTFGPYLLVLHYGAGASMMGLLFAVSAVCCTVLSPYVGKLIDRVGYKTVMVADTLILVVVCFFYGFAEHFFSTQVSFIICCIMYVLDSVISLASMASNVYVKDISDSPQETRSTITTGMSVNHFITILVALFGGWIWKVTGIETLFTISAVIGLLNSAYASTIKTSGKKIKYGR